MSCTGTVYNDMQDMSFRISVMTLTQFSHNASPQLIQAFIEKSLDPLRGSTGIGVYPNTKYVILYQTVAHAEANKNMVMEVITSLVEEAEEWQSKLQADVTSKERESKIGQDSHLRMLDYL